MPATTTAANKGFVFLNLTCNRGKEQDTSQHQQPSTHDYAEMMLYAFVDSAPSVADLLWSKQQLGQGEFLTLTAADGQEWSNTINTTTTDASTTTKSTHEPQLF
jgi:hypothetical protein